MRNAKQSIRRTVAGLLAGAMLLGMTPLAAFAEGSSSASGDWQFKAFGTSAAAGVNTIADGADINGKVTLNSCTIKDDGTIDKKGGKFVADSPADGLSFYYTTIDPTTQNFYLQADVTIDYVNPAPDGQEGFALMVRDSISGSGSYFSNQISVVGTKLPLDGVEIKDAVGVRSYTGIISNETAASNDVKSNRAAFSSQAIKQGDTYRVSLAKTSNSYVATQYAINADGSTGDVIGSSTLYIPAKDSTASSVSKYAELDDPMTVQEANKAYLGFAAARGMNVTFSNITYTTSTWNASEWTLQPTSYVAPVYQITSPATCTGDSYELVFKANADGKATVSANGVVVDKDVDIKAGERLALVGPSGGGKTTLCNLIPRFYEVTDGRILIDGQDIRHVTLKSLRQDIGIVQQDVYLFSGTVAQNIAYGKPGATREEIVEAARLAGAERFILALKDGFDTYVGERGVKLSGGQKQRIAIARVFLKNPSILILDEATSALDNESEILVGQSLEKLAHGRTTLTIAHRLTTIKDYDRILVLGEEGIVESGTHEQLLVKQGVYYRLWNQLPGEDTL